MSEESLRELERRWRASGDPQDERRWLTARARAGELVMLCLPLGGRLRPRVAAVAALARERYAAEEPPRPA